MVGCQSIRQTPDGTVQSRCCCSMVKLDWLFLLGEQLNKLQRISSERSTSFGRPAEKAADDLPCSIFIFGYAARFVQNSRSPSAKPWLSPWGGRWPLRVLGS